MTSLDASSRWGVLPFAVALSVLAIVRLGAVSGRAPFGRHGALRGAVLFLAAVVVAVRVLGHVGHLARWPLFALLVLGAALVSAYRRDRSCRAGWAKLVSRENAPMVAVAALALAITGRAAWLLPVWQWDALGYHLPYVDFALQGGSLAGVPPDLPYISTYPHAIEDYFIAWRAMLPDDRLVDAAQLPLGLLGAGAIAVVARDLGARHDHALFAGLAWLTLPATFLQLPTNYIDVGSASLLLAAAAFALAPPTVENVASAGVALGLFLGSKPNAPIATCLVGGLVLVRAARAGRRTSLVVGAVAVVLLGTESYLTNLARHGNPIWPVQVKLGPLELNGLLPMQVLLDSGCAAPRVHGPLPVRLLRSWTSFDAPPVFDMRYGGLGLVFLVALPCAVLVAWKRRSVPLAVLAVAALASPDPVVPRYILAFPGLVLAVASSGLARLEATPRRALLGVLSVAATVGILRARAGLVGDGPPLGDYTKMTEPERLRAVGADGPPSPFYDALDRLAPGEVTVFDGSLELPYLAWRPDLATEARWMGDASEEGAARILADPKVRLLMVDDRSALAAAARGDPRFEEIHQCKPRIPPKCLQVDVSSAHRDAPLVKSLTETSSCVFLLRR